MAGGLGLVFYLNAPGQKCMVTFLTFDLLVKIVILTILHALLAATMTNILLVSHKNQYCYNYALVKTIL